MALVNAAAETGRRCFPQSDPEFQVELGRTVSRIDDFVLANSDSTMEMLAAFKREQSQVGGPEAAVCHGDLKQHYMHSASRGADLLRSETDKILARPGPPTWGDCP